MRNSLVYKKRALDSITMTEAVVRDAQIRYALQIRYAPTVTGILKSLVDFWEGNCNLANIVA